MLHADRPATPTSPDPTLTQAARSTCIHGIFVQRSAKPPPPRGKTANIRRCVMCLTTCCAVPIGAATTSAGDSRTPSPAPQVPHRGAVDVCASGSASLRADLATLRAKELEAARILAARESYKPHQRELNR